MIFARVILLLFLGLSVVIEFVQLVRLFKKDKKPIKIEIVKTCSYCGMEFDNLYSKNCKFCGAPLPKIEIESNEEEE